MSEVLNLEVAYFTEQIGDELPYSVIVKGDRVADQLPRNHHYWVEWGIDVLEASGDIKPYGHFDPVVIPKTEEELALEKREDAKFIRDGAVESNIHKHGVWWQVHVTNDEPRINRAIRTAEIENLPLDTTAEWILADNSIRATTAAELAQVLVAKSRREQDVFNQYKTWVVLGMTEPFTPDIDKEY